MRWLALAGALVALGADPAAAYRIGIFTDSTATGCSLQVHQIGTQYMWLVALLDDAPEPPIIGAEFSVVGFPADWSVSVDTSPYRDRTSLLRFPHVLLAFYDLPSASGGILPLARLEIQALSQVGPTRVWVDRASPPTNPGWEGPVLILEEQPAGECDGGSPRYVPVPATGLSAMINGPCSVGVQSMTWQGVKILYRD